jgi:hypothetical protein
LWKEYAEDVAQHLDPKNEGAMGKLVRDLHKTARTDFESNYERVKRYLEGFKNISA